MARVQLIPYQKQTVGQLLTSAPFDAGGLKSYTLYLDVMPSDWGTRNPSTASTGDYEWSLEGSIDNFVTKKVWKATGCIGGRSKTTGLPTWVITPLEGETWPAGMKARITFKLLTNYVKSVGVKGEGSTTSFSRYIPKFGGEHHSLAYIGATQQTRLTGQNSVTIPITVANANSLIVVCIFLYNSGGSFCNVDDGGPLYTIVGGLNLDGASKLDIHAKENHGAGAFNVVVNPDGSSADIEAYVVEVTGAKIDGTAYDNSYYTSAARGTAASTISLTSPFTPAQQKNIVFVGVTHDGDNRDFSSPTINGVPATEIAEQQDNSSGQAGYFFFGIRASAAPISMSAQVGVGLDSNYTLGICYVNFKDIDSSAAAVYSMEASPGAYALTGAQNLIGLPVYMYGGTGAESQRTGTTNPHTWTHTPLAGTTPNGIVVTVVHGTSATDHVTAMTYGGVAMTKIVSAIHNTGEPGMSQIWFLGSGIPAGPQTISATLASATGDDIHFVSNALYNDENKDMEAIDNDNITGIIANPTRTLQYGGKKAMAVGAFYGGANSPAFTPNANCTSSVTWDMGNFYSVIFRQTKSGTADFVIGGTVASDDVALAVAAFAAIAVLARSVETLPGAYAAAGINAINAKNRFVDFAVGTYAPVGFQTNLTKVTDIPLLATPGAYGINVIPGGPLFGPDHFTVGADVNINEYPSIGSPHYSTGGSMIVNATNDRIQTSITGAWPPPAARCIAAGVLVDQEIRCNSSLNLGNDFAGLTVRMGAGPDYYYLYHYEYEGEQWVQLWRMDSGSPVALPSGDGFVTEASLGPVALRFRATGTNPVVLEAEITGALIDGLPILTYSDYDANRKTSGYAGLALYQEIVGAAWIDDLEVDDLLPHGGGFGYDASLLASRLLNVLPAPHIVSGINADLITVVPAVGPPPRLPRIGWDNRLRM